MIRNLEVVGEANRNIERAHPEFAAAHPELPLTLANDMRNALSHGYFKVDLEIVWKTFKAICRLYTRKSLRRWRPCRRLMLMTTV